MNFPGKTALRNLARKFLGGELSSSSMFSGWLGSSRMRFLLPGSKFDHERHAGDLWRNSVAALAIDWLGKRFPRPRLKACQLDRKGQEVEIPNHPLVALWQRPNKAYNRRALEKAVGLSLIVDGNAYIHKVRSRGQQVVELWYVPHFLIYPKGDPTGAELIGSYDILVDGRLYNVPASEIIHVRDGIDPYDVRLGMSAMKSQLREICTDNAAANHSAGLLRNSAIPGLMITPDDPMVRPNQADAQEIIDLVEERFTGDGAGGTIVMKGKYKVTSVGFSPEQLAFDKLTQPAAARIGAAAGVAPMAMGLPDPGKTYSNLEEAVKTSWGTIVSTQELIAEGLQYQLLPDFGGDPDRIKLGYDYHDVQELQESLNDVHARARDDYRFGLIMLNEARDWIGMEQDVDGDRYFPGTGSPDDPTPAVGNPPDLPVKSNGNGLAHEFSRGH